MTTGHRRRDVLLLGGTMLAASLAGCMGGGGDGGGGDGASGTTTAGGDGGSGTTTGGGNGGDGDGGSNLAQVAVGEVATSGPIQLLATGVERLPTAPIFGLGIRAAEGNTFVAPTILLKNASDRHVALVVDGLGVHVEGTTYATEEPYVDIYSPEFGGLPLAPGELRRLRMYFEVPDGRGNGQFRLVLRTRSLPGGFGAQRRVAVELDQTAGSLASLTQTLAVEPLSVGETADFDGLSVTVAGVSFPEEVQRRPPPDGTEYVAVSLAATHGADIPNRVLLGLGGFGGMDLHDDTGVAYDDRVVFNGTIDGGREFFASSGIAPGESHEGVSVVTVPEGVEPLYLTWSPPANFWVPGTGASSNRAIWQLR